MRKVCIILLVCVLNALCVSFSCAEDPVELLQHKFNAVAEKIYPTVVSITTVHIEQVAGELCSAPFEDTLFDDFLGELFGYSGKSASGYRAPSYEKRHVGVGSGIIVDKKGFILTNYHLVENAEKNRVAVRLTDRNEYEGIIVGIDAKYDLAVIKIKENDLPAAELADSDDIKVGDWAIAIGNPYGFVFEDAQPTMTVGVVSALNRTLPGGARYGRSYSNLIQTDASINLGNSGGPLVNIEGKVMGINVAIVSTTGGNQGIGFALPSKHCRDVVAQFVQGKQIAYGWLGVEAQSMNKDLAAYFDLDIDHGVVVMDTIKDSPAYKAGLKEGDILISFDSKMISDLDALLAFIENAGPGAQVKIGYIRGERNGSVSVVLEPRTNVPVDVSDREANYWRGIKPAVITAGFIDRYNLPSRSGVAVARMLLNSSAAESGLIEGDVILKMNDKVIESLDDFFSFKDFNEDVLMKTHRGYFVVKRDEG